MARTVLLADDSVTAQNMGRRILMDAGYEVITVNNGSAALKRIHESQPDLIVLDVYMPGYGGLEVCQRLKESGETMRIPVLLTVGKMEPFKVDEAKRVRADAHIIKPFEASELLAALAKLEDRIVPQADASRGRRKKPSFWHAEDEHPAPAREWTDNVAYLTHVKQRKGDESMASSPEPVQNSEPEPAPVPVKRAFPRVPEATEELPVIADANVAPAAEAISGEIPVANVPEQSPAAATEMSGSEPSQAETNTSELKPVAEDVALSREDAQQATQESDVAEIPSLNPVEEAAEAPEAHGPPAATVAAARWIAENVALSPEEAALELEQEMHAAEALEKAQAASATQVSASVPAAQPSPEQTNGATFAAAAAASSSGAVSSTQLREDAAEGPVASETAAAWENWKQIRESVMNLSNAASIAETVAQAAQASVSQESSLAPENVNAMPESSAQSANHAESSTETSTDSALETGALASIVDTVLAELKPKLMAEIAKKLKK